MATSTTDTKDTLKKRLGVTGEFTGRDNRTYWITKRCFVIDPGLAGTPMPRLLAQLIHLTKTPLDMIYRIQQGLGVYDMDGNSIPMDVGGTRPKPEGYQLFSDALRWLESNYPDIGGWFYAVDTIHKASK